jgi:hypothetical protein
MSLVDDDGLDSWFCVALRISNICDCYHFASAWQVTTAARLALLEGSSDVTCLFPYWLPCTLLKLSSPTRLFHDNEYCFY